MMRRLEEQNAEIASLLREQSELHRQRRHANGGVAQPA
jgi:hypothetical protein